MAISSTGFDPSTLGARPGGHQEAPRIDAGVIDDIKRRTDIAAVVSRHVELKRAGGLLKGLCPFHGEKSPSFVVTPAKQSYHCFGCGAHGDAVQFLIEMEGGSFRETIEDLAQAAGVLIPTTPVPGAAPPRARPAKAEAQLMHDALEHAAHHYASQLQTALRDPRRSAHPEFAAMAASYVRERRGLDMRTLAHFGIGLAMPGWNSLRAAFPDYDTSAVLPKVDLVRVREEDKDKATGEAPRAGFAVKAGFGRPAASRQSSSCWDTFRERLLFPVRNPAGKIVAFGGRRFNDEDKGSPKYLNSADTPIFHKNSILFGLYEARSAIREQKFALVVEGYMDVAMLFQFGFDNAVAAMGTACTESHLQTLLRFTDAVVFLFDGDAAGRKAARKAAEVALGLVTSRNDVRILVLPQDQDPDEYLRAHGAEQLRRALAEQAQPLSTFLREQLLAECNQLRSPEDRARYQMKFQALLRLMPGERDNPLAREYWKMFQGTLNAVTGQGWQPRGRANTEPPRAPSLGAPSSLVAKLREAAATAPDIALEQRDAICALLDDEDAEERGLLAALAAIGVSKPATPAAPGSAQWMAARDVLTAHGTLMERYRLDQARAALKKLREAGEISLPTYLHELKSLS